MEKSKASRSAGILSSVFVTGFFLLRRRGYYISMRLRNGLYHTTASERGLPTNRTPSFLCEKVQPEIFGFRVLLTRVFSIKPALATTPGMKIHWPAPELRNSMLCILIPTMLLGLLAPTEDWFVIRF